MLSVSRKINERVMIGQDISVMVTSIGAKSVRLGVEAPRSVPIYREELEGREPQPDGRRIASKNDVPELTDWPTRQFRFWWMRCQTSKRSKPRVLLVELMTHEGTEFVRPFQDNNCYPQSICREWEAKFKPCESDPIF